MPVERITREQLKERLDRGDRLTIVDVRLKYAYEHSTVKLPGAIRMPPYAMESVTLPAGTDVVAYDSDPNELVSTRVAGELLRKGFKVAVLKGGVPEWLAANFPIETKEAPRFEPAGARFSQQGLKPSARGLGAAAVGLAAFCCYRAALLPGLDLGDTASFQTGVSSWTVTPRQAYPLYYALGHIFVALDRSHEAAHAMNLASAAYGGLAVALMVWVAAGIFESLAGGLVAGLLLGASYTFWTQAVIAEVYTLHLLLLGACLAQILAWARHPTRATLLAFYAVYALSFGNHLSSILLLPSFALFILMNRPPGRDDPLRPGNVGLAAGIAAMGALQYAWNFLGLWSDLSPPATAAEALSKFWVDTTKADWRQTLVMQVSEAGLRNRPAMYWFDLRQQVGATAVVFAAAGLAWLLVRRPTVAALVVGLYLVNLLFAWTYNVGDVHVFFLPSHYFVALCAGGGAAALIGATRRLAGPAAVAAATGLCLVYPVWRAYDTFPAVDRSWDHRPTQALDRLTTPPARPDANSAAPKVVFGLDANWQLQNAVEYYMREHKPAVPWFTSADLGWLQAAARPAGPLRRFVDANTAAGRQVIVTPDFAAAAGVRPGDALLAAGPIDPELPLAAEIGALPANARYVLAVLRPYRAVSARYRPAPRRLRGTVGRSRMRAFAEKLHGVRGHAGASAAACARERSPLPHPARPRRRGHRDPDGVVAPERYDPAGGVRPCSRRKTARADAGSRRELRRHRRGGSRQPRRVPQRAVRARAAPSPHIRHSRRTFPCYGWFAMSTGVRVALALLTTLAAAPAGVNAQGASKERGQNPQTVSAEAVARDLQRKYNRVSDFSTDFVHSYRGGILKQQATERGHLLVKKPGKMRWDYSSPEKKTFVSDGHKLYSYIPADRQVIVSTVPPDDEAPTPALFLSGKGDITRDFNVSLDRVPEAAPGLIALRLAPKRPEAEYSSLTLVVEPGSLDLAMLVSEDAQGGRSVFTFSNLKENVGLADSQFVFKIPRGVDVITDVPDK